MEEEEGVGEVEEAGEVEEVKEEEDQEVLLGGEALGGGGDLDICGDIKRPKGPEDLASALWVIIVFETRFCDFYTNDQ